MPRSGESGRPRRSSAMGRGVLVTHSGRQHSHRLAVALEEAGLLRGYWTGIPTRALVGGLIPARLWRRFIRYDTVPLPADRVRHAPISPILRKTIGPLLPGAWTVAWAHRADYAFDRWAAWRLRRLSGDPPAAVVAYENAALRTFEVAREMGTMTILDAAALHHTGQDAECAYPESDRAHRRITARKDAEIRLADHIITVSEFSRETYVRAGADPDRVTVVPLGVDLERFRVPEGPGKPTDGPLEILFAGAAAYHKGFDVLVDAVRGLEDGVDVRVTVVGRDREGWRERAGVEFHWLGQVSQGQLAELYRQADVLVLPSRHDALPMVVLEALASGLPVVVSDRVGSKEAVEEGVNGWVLPAGDVEALRDRLTWCAGNRSALHAMVEPSRAAAAGYSWDAYAERVIGLIGGLVEDAGPGAG